MITNGGNELVFLCRSVAFLLLCCFLVVLLEVVSICGTVDFLL